MSLNATERPEDYERETVPSERDAVRLLELLDRSSSWNARLAASLDAYQLATGGHPGVPFEWPPKVPSDPGRRC